MTKRIGRVGHCYRCIYTWRFRRRGYPAVCPRCKSRLWNVPRIRPIVLGSGLGIEEVLGPHRAEILRLGREHGARRLWVFGSVRRREATRKSDVDLMIQWDRPVSLLVKAELNADLEETLGRKVDLVNEGGLNWAIEPQVEAERVPL
ncbi:MAG: nucleotidyltransferase family protein [Thermoplasmata archaeon]|nr:nucleotidyltransferase family protein [Thermoplasmata archaeon]